MRLRFLLRPGWLALVLGVLVFAGACFWLLSPWQFGRNTEREQRNAAISKSLHTPAVAGDSLHGSPSANEWRKVTFRGRFLPDGEVLARLRTVDGNPAFDVLTPFRPEHGKPLLVDRGSVPQNNGKPPSYPPPPRGTVHVQARVHPDEHGKRAGQVLRAEGHTQVYAVSSKVVGRITGTELRSGSYALTESQPGALHVESLPQRDSGPFFSYALQWIAFGVMSLLGLGYFTWRELKPGGALSAERRAERRANAGSEQSGPGRRKPRGRKGVAAAVAEEERAERSEYADHGSS